jgi:hypothetical protein
MLGQASTRQPVDTAIRRWAALAMSRGEGSSRYIRSASPPQRGLTVTALHRPLRPRVRRPANSRLTNSSSRAMRNVDTCEDSVPFSAGANSHHPMLVSSIGTSGAARWPKSWPGMSTRPTSSDAWRRAAASSFRSPRESGHDRRALSLCSVRLLGARERQLPPQ